MPPGQKLLIGHATQGLVALVEKKPALQAHAAAELEPWGASELSRHCDTVPLRQKPTEQRTQPLVAVVLPPGGAYPGRHTHCAMAEAPSTPAVVELPGHAVRFRVPPGQKAPVSHTWHTPPAR